ncbi:MAG: hypothetical protein ACQETK_11375 [Pseudomonadota bacterium]
MSRSLHAVVSVTVFLFALALAGCGGETPAKFGEGNPFPEVALNDAAGNSVSVPGDARVVMKTVEMAPANIANAVLGDMSTAQREAVGIVYIADTHQMPPHVLENVVLPRMQAREYPTLITATPEDAGFLPHRREHVTVVLLDGAGTVTDVEFAASEDELRGLLASVGE